MIFIEFQTIFNKFKDFEKFITMKTPSNLNITLKIMLRKPPTEIIMIVEKSVTHISCDKRHNILAADSFLTEFHIEAVFFRYTQMPAKT